MVREFHTSSKMASYHSERRCEANAYSESGHQSGVRYLSDISKLLIKRKLAFVCDKPTEAYGNCFPFSIMQQLHRPEIRCTLSEEIRVLSENYYDLRQAVVQFITNMGPISDYYDLRSEEHTSELQSQ